MRTKPLIGRKAWFGPRRFGWGLSPVTAEGWAVLAIGIAAIIGLAAAFRHDWLIVIIPVVVMLAVVFLKGTSPGGPREWDEYQSSRDAD